jgi:hypothetical protein
MFVRYWAHSTALGFCLGLFCTASLEAQSDKPKQQLGSTMTLERLTKGPAKPESAKPKRQLVMAVEPADQPTPIFRYRFWPHPRSLRAGNAYLHFSRALTLSLQVQVLQKKAWNDYQVALGDADPKAEDIAKHIAPYQMTLNELEQFAKCEDMSWDHRLRDIEGPAIYSFLLPEVQEARSLARLLRFRILEQLQRGDFDGAFMSIQTGYRLASFLRNGETLIQQLVGVAIEGIMQSVVLDAIRTPGCPNLYWALATVPHTPQPMQRAMELEFSTVERLVPVLQDAENSDWDQATWARKWQESVKELEHLVTQSVGGDGNGIALSVVLAVQISTGEEAAKDRLLRYGLAADKVNAMCAEQAIAVDTVYQLREWGDRMTREYYLPYAMGNEMRKQDEEEFKRWTSDNKQSVAGMLGGLLYPATTAAGIAVQRNLAFHNRLMTIEAVRDYAETHNNQLPKSLSDLEELPALLDPFTGQTIGYEVVNENGKDVACFTVEVSNLPDELRKVRITFAK